MDLSPQWIVAKVHTRRETYAAQNLHRLGIETYLPRTHQTETPRAMFPGYLFVRSHLGQFYAMKSCWGVRGFLMQGDRPATLHPKVLDEIRVRESEQQPQTQNKYYQGQPLIVTSGLLENKQVTCIRDHRQATSVLLTLVHNSVRLSVPHSQLRPM